MAVDKSPTRSTRSQACSGRSPRRSNSRPTVPDNWRTLQISPYKGLEQTLLLSDSRIIAQRSSPLGLLTVVESPTIPLRHAPGLSLNATTEPPAQLAVFTDGDGLSVISHYQGDRLTLAAL